MKFQIALPWPPKGLSPNARLNRYAKAALFKKTKDGTFILARRSMKAAGIETVSGIDRNNPMNLRLILTPPVLRYRDEDNLIANCKAVFDGVAQALGIDDHNFHLREQIWYESAKPGKLVIELDWEEAANG